MPVFKLIVNLRGNKPLILDKVIYTEHPLAAQLQESLISEYNPTWTKNINLNRMNLEKQPHKIPTKKLEWDNF